MTTSWQVEPAPELSGFTIEWAGPGGYILSRREVLYHAEVLEPPFVEFGRLPLVPQLQIAARVAVARRALRLAYYNVVPIGDGRVFATFNRSVALVTPDDATPVAGLERPFRVLRDGCAITSDGAIWFGEYIIAREPSPLRIYRLAPPADRAEIVHVFPAGFTRHIHGMYVDPFDESLWCLTGDLGDHAKILRSPNGSELFAVVGQGDESWRAVSVQFRRDAIYYATDAQKQPNWIYRIDRGTGDRSQVALLDGPVYYSHRVGDDLFFAVTAEQQGRRATLWHLGRDDHCVELASYPKDRLPVNQFLPGTLNFPSGSGDGSEFYFSGVALSGIDGAVFRCKREPS